MKDDTISRQAALDALDKVAEMFPYRIPGNAKTYRQYNEAWSDAIDAAENALEALPSAQPEQRNARVFQGIIVEYPSISAYPEYEGKPYFSIKYTENGQGFIGYGTYKPEVLSEYLKEYFMPPTQPGCEDAVSRTEAVEALYDWEQMYTWDEHCKEDGGESPYIVSPSSIIEKLPPVTPKQPGWIPVTERLPENDNDVLVTDGEDCAVAYWRTDAQAWDDSMHGWCDLYGLEVVAWMPLPAPYREGGQDG